MRAVTVMLSVVLASGAPARAQDAEPATCVGAHCAVKFADFDPHWPPPATYPTPLFALSQDYPQAYVEETFAWETIDFKVFPHEYLRAVLEYCLEGNDKADFRVQDNTVRKWYHAPWLHDDSDTHGAGREYHHGLTRERRSRELELHRQQTDRAQNWAVGIYNDRGGVTLGKVWRTADGNPDPRQATFPPNTVACKLLFTDASDDQVPYLQGSKAWTANIYPDTKYDKPRVDRTMRLLQVDVAVKEPRAGITGWVFGTFIYDAFAPGLTVWDHLRPVGLSWGDDVGAKTEATRDGAFVNTTLSSLRLNTDLVEQAGWEYGNRAYVRHHGLGGRLNGPVDNPVSSCISCHGRAGNLFASPSTDDTGTPMEFAALSISKPSSFPMDRFDFFFGPIAGDSHAEKQGTVTFTTVDYSLQLMAGIRNFYQARRVQLPAAAILQAGEKPKPLSTFNGKKPLPTVTRETD